MGVCVDHLRESKELDRHNLIESQGNVSRDFGIHLFGLGAMIWPMSYIELTLNTSRRHCARLKPSAFKPESSGSPDFSP
jgi:hypothetical protein